MHKWSQLRKQLYVVKFNDESDYNAFKVLCKSFHMVVPMAPFDSKYCYLYNGWADAFIGGDFNKIKDVEVVSGTGPVTLCFLSKEECEALLKLKKEISGC